MREVKNKSNLTEIRETAAAIIDGYKAERAGIEAAAEKAQEEKAAAEQARENAISVSEYEEATQQAKDAELKAEFIGRLLERLKHNPRMAEEDYTAAVEDCRKEAETARNNFRAAADDHLEQLQAAKQEYEAKIKEINETLQALDAAANVLQNKYKNRVINYNGGETKETRDPYEWKRHAQRYDAADYFYTCKNPDRPHAIHHSVYTAAWRAIYEAYPERMF